MTDELIPPSSDALVQELRALIEATRGRVAQTINSELVWPHRRVGKRLREEIVGEERAEYGEEVVGAVARALKAEYGRGFSKRNIYIHDALRGGLPRPGDCARTAFTIELDPLPRADRHRRPAQAAVLRRDVPHRAVEHARARALATGGKSTLA